MKGGVRVLFNCLRLVFDPDDALRDLASEPLDGRLVGFPADDALLERRRRRRRKSWADRPGKGRCVMSWDTFGRGECPPRLWDGVGTSGPGG